MKKNKTPLGKNKIHREDVIDLAADICGMEYETDPKKIEKALYDKFQISMENFHKLCDHLLLCFDI
jgi:hypothetical protein